jgi:hypothetical protein
MMIATSCEKLLPLAGCSGESPRSGLLYDFLGTSVFQQFGRGGAHPLGVRSASHMIDGA